MENEPNKLEWRTVRVAETVVEQIEDEKKRLRKLGSKVSAGDVISRAWAYYLSHPLPRPGESATIPVEVKISSKGGLTGTESGITLALNQSEYEQVLSVLEVLRSPDNQLADLFRTMLSGFVGVVRGTAAQRPRKKP